MRHGEFFYCIIYISDERKLLKSPSTMTIVVHLNADCMPALYILGPNSLKICCEYCKMWAGTCHRFNQSPRQLVCILLTNIITILLCVCDNFILTWNLKHLFKHFWDNCVFCPFCNFPILSFFPMELVKSIQCYIPSLIR